MRSLIGYQGCLSSLDFGSGTYDLLEPGRSQISDELRDQIRTGCGGMLLSTMLYLF